MSNSVCWHHDGGVSCSFSSTKLLGTQVIQAILPLLLDKGMTNPSDEVKAIRFVIKWTPALCLP